MSKANKLKKEAETRLPFLKKYGDAAWYLMGAVAAILFALIVWWIL